MTKPAPLGTAGEPPRRFRDLKRERTRRALGVAALELFEKQGYERTTIEEITRLAGVSRPTFFRYFDAKEDALFWDEEESVALMVDFVAKRDDRSYSLAALAVPFSSFATYFGDATPFAERRAALIMTTRALENRSLQVRQLWESALVRLFADEHPAAPLPAAEILLADIAVSCYVVALRRWRHDPAASLTQLTAESFRSCRALLETTALPMDRQARATRVGD